jgi:hypothetical protein
VDEANAIDMVLLSHGAPAMAREALADELGEYEEDETLASVDSPDSENREANVVDMVAWMDRANELL